MKTALALAEVETGGVGAIGSFSIKATGKAFKILSDGLYSDKPLAIVRELSCNAYDAHVAGGCSTTPFEVHLPNPLEPWFSVRDFGIGLSDADVMELYTTYFASSKTDSDDFIGALGLGSKSPFSYVDSFTVTSRFHGSIRTYTAFLNDQGIPSIARMSEDSTDEGNGLEVSMPVSSKDFGAFANKARELLNRFNPLPIITGSKSELEVRSYVIGGVGWNLRTDEGYGYSGTSRSWAVMGHVAYPIAYDAMGEQLTEEERDILGLELDIDFNIGDLEVTASREKLQYDPRTIANIKQRLGEISKDFPSHFEARFSACSTLWEARSTWSALKHQLSVRVIGILSASMFWGGKKVSETDVEVETIRPCLVLLKKKQLGRKRFPLNEVSRATIRAEEGSLIYWDDLTLPKRLQDRLKHEFISEMPDTVLIVRIPDRAQLQLLLDQLGNPPFKKVSDLELPAIQKSQEPRKPRNKTSIKRVLLFTNLQWVDAYHDLNLGGVYVKLIRGDSEYHYNLRKIVDAISTLGIHSGPLFGIPAVNKHIPEKYPGWVELKDLLAQKITLPTDIHQKVANKRALIHHIDIRLDNKVIDFLGLCKTENVVFLDGSPASELSKAIQLLENDPVSDDMVNAISTLEIDVLRVNPSINLHPLMRDFKTRFPLCEKFSSYETELFPAWVDYFNRS
jgi:hypothetical protein